MCIRDRVDDLATGAANDEEMYDTLKLLFSQCREFGVALNAEKFCYGHRINFGGCILSEDGVTADPNRLQAIAEFETPDSREKVRRFLGICQTLSQYTACLQQSTINMKRLLRKDVPFQWGEEEEREFNAVKKEMSDPKLLSFFKPGLTLGLDVDTNPSKGIGYVAYQFNEEKGEPGEGNFNLLKLGSISANERWCRYSAIENEANGILVALKKLNYFYIGCPKIVVRTDHRPLQQAWTNRDLTELSPRMRKIFLELYEYNLQMKWVAGSSPAMLLVDGLGRAPRRTSSRVRTPWTTMTGHPCLTSHHLRSNIGLA